MEELEADVWLGTSSVTLFAPLDRALSAILALFENAREGERLSFADGGIAEREMGSVSEEGGSLSNCELLLIFG